MKDKEKKKELKESVKSEGKEPEAGVKMVKDSSITGSNKKTKKRLRK